MDLELRIEPPDFGRVAAGHNREGLLLTQDPRNTFSGGKGRFRPPAECNDDAARPTAAVRQSCPDLAVLLGVRPDNPNRGIGGSGVHDSRPGWRGSGGGVAD